jgi:hypothetical protein
MVSFHISLASLLTVRDRSEALPKGVVIEQRFEDKYPQLVSDSINAMYEWAKKGLQGKFKWRGHILVLSYSLDYGAARDGSPGQPAPVFPVSVEALDDMSPNMVAQTVTDFLIKSYSEPFRSSPRKPNPNIPCLQKLRLGTRLRISHGRQLPPHPTNITTWGSLT